jgi:hypothetical protein
MSTALAGSFDTTWLSPPIRAAQALTDAFLVIGTLISLVVYIRAAQLPLSSHWHGTLGKVRKEGTNWDGERRIHTWESET